MSVAASVVVPAAVALLSFTVSLDLAVADFRRVLAAPRTLGAGLAAQLLVLPLLALGLGLLIDDPVVRVALLLVALVPSGPTSNYLAALARGDVSLAILLTVGGTLLAVFTLPVALPWVLQSGGLAAGELRLPLGELLQGLLLVVVLPVSAGMLFAHRAPDLARRWRPRATRIASAAFALLVIGAIAVEWRQLSSIFLRSALWVCLLNLGAMAAGWAVARAAALPPEQRTVLTIKCALQNVSIALAIAIALMQRLDIAAVAALYGVWQLLTAVAFALLQRRRG